MKMAVSVIARDEVNAAGNPMYQRLAITERDMKMLDDLFTSALTSLVTELRTVKILPETDGLNLELPDFDEYQTPYAVLLAESYLKDSITGSWLKRKGSAMYEPFLNSSEGSLVNLKSVLFTRKAPSKKYFGEKEEF